MAHEEDQRFSARDANAMANQANVKAAILKYMPIIDEKIRQAAFQGRYEIHYAVEDLTIEGEREKVIDAITAELRTRGYKVQYVASQDPGHPCDRPNTTVSW